MLRQSGSEYHAGVVRNKALPRGGDGPIFGSKLFVGEVARRNERMTGKSEPNAFGLVL